MTGSSDKNGLRLPCRWPADQRRDDCGCCWCAANAEHDGFSAESRCTMPVRPRYSAVCHLRGSERDSTILERQAHVVAPELRCPVLGWNQGACRKKRETEQQWEESGRALH